MATIPKSFVPPGLQKMYAGRTLNLVNVCRKSLMARRAVAPRKPVSSKDFNRIQIASINAGGVRATYKFDHSLNNPVFAVRWWTIKAQFAQQLKLSD